ncbi:hypothetical protein A2W14_06220 [Candidatus Gottesmanbacteria bacterium RBG_16_37_8]|uniref:Peptidase S1 domain-containing protein n=1 Tax=Candidatus Gottesmanbacteria bacterium RBG_16_37_8 TaxID=1798371 RepID=A0A1F5YV44_9BACT|nr:MAG: hypothetical protein A2W14_06220 [Candidatus Gottesmanbacteria bacterium RBG_16_37_8]
MVATSQALLKNPEETSRLVESLSEAIKNRAIKITITAPPKGDSFDTVVGSGTIFYEDNDNLIILTAGHVIKSGLYDYSSCNFFISRNHWHANWYDFNRSQWGEEISTAVNPDLDIGLILIKKNPEYPKLFSENGFGLIKGAPATEEMHPQMLSYPIGLATSFIPYNEMNIRKVKEDIIITDAKSDPSYKGASGGGLFDGDMLIGVHYWGDNEKLKFVPITAASSWIAETITEKLNLGQ